MAPMVLRERQAGQLVHLERAARRRLDEGDADVFRASFVRGALAADEETAAAGPDAGPE